MKKEFWINEEEINKIDWVKKYNTASSRWLKLTPDEISVKYSYFTIAEHKKFIQEICQKLKINIKGNGLEIGSGPGILSISILKIFKDVKKIYLLEMVPKNFDLIKKVAKYNGTEKKLSCIIGDFNNLKFQKNSLDFILDFDSIHHSENFDKTFDEISRVLKPGGILLCFDRAHPNYTSLQQINDMLNIEYSDEYKLENGININDKFTRRMNGEHEPLLKDWVKTSQKYGLKSRVFIFYTKSLKNFMKALYGLIIPYWLKKLLNKGINITTHYQLILSYFKINNASGIKTFRLNYKAKNKKSPASKMVFLFEKT